MMFGKFEGLMVEFCVVIDSFVYDLCFLFVWLCIKIE